MLASQRIQLKQSETRQRLNELLGKDELADAERGEMEGLTKRAQEMEVEMRAAIMAEGRAGDARRNPRRRTPRTRRTPLVRPNSATSF